MIHEINNNELSITKDNAPILTYSYGNAEGPPYFHPFYAPNGQMVTEGEYTHGQRPPGICFHARRNRQWRAAGSDHTDP